MELTVRDTGVGIPENELPRVFERFHRVEGARSRTHEGSGIGLALTRELVRLHGGTITVDEPGRRRVRASRCGYRPGARTCREDRIDAVPDRSSSTAIGAAPFVDEARRWLPPA